MTTVNIGDKVLTIMSDTVDPVAEVLETVTEAQDLPGSTPDTAADTGVEVGSRVSE